MIDWDTFAARVPAGTQIRWDLSLTAYMWIDRYQYGVLLESHPYDVLDKSAISHAVNEGNGDKVDFPDIYETWFADEVTIQLYGSNFYRDVEPLRRSVEELEYLIDGQWLTYEQVMA